MLFCLYNADDPPKDDTELSENEETLEALNYILQQCVLQLHKCSNFSSIPIPILAKVFQAATLPLWLLFQHQKRIYR